MDLNQIDFNDSKVFELISRGDTFGVFQLESEGMKQLLIKMKVDCFDDIVAANALFRPGPMENIPQYLARRHGQEKIESIDPSIDPILAPTYGIMIYQEQIMQIAKVFAGFSLGKADILRKAISKKQTNLMMSLKEEFIQGAIDLGHEKELAERIYDLILKFANYGFNKSHSVAYAYIAYQMAYLKVYYPLEFFSALITSESGSTSAKLSLIQEGKRYGVALLPPSINRSTNRFEVEDGNIRYALTAVKNVGYSAYQEIEKARMDGPFTDLFDFFVRIHPTRLSSKAVESLIRAGALDEFGYDRKMIEENMDALESYADLYNTLGLDEKPILKLVRDDRFTRLEEEKEVLGIYLTKHPVALIKERYHGNIVAINDFEKYVTRRVNSIVCLQRIKVIRDKKGQNMCFLTMYDETGTIDAVVFADTYHQYEKQLRKGQIYLIEGKVTKKDRLSFIVNKMKRLSGGAR